MVSRQKVMCRTLAIEVNENGVCTIPYLQWLLSHFTYLGHVAFKNYKGKNSY